MARITKDEKTAYFICRGSGMNIKSIAEKFGVGYRRVQKVLAGVGKGTSEKAKIQALEWYLNNKDTKISSVSKQFGISNTQLSTLVSSFKLIKKMENVDLKNYPRWKK